MVCSRIIHLPFQLKSEMSDFVSMEEFFKLIFFGNLAKPWRKNFDYCINHTYFHQSGLTVVGIYLNKLTCDFNRQQRKLIFEEGNLCGKTCEIAEKTTSPDVEP